MKTLSILTDPVYQPKKSFNFYERFWLKLMNDKRDLPFIRLLTLIHLTVVPLAILLFTPLLSGWVWWAVAVPYFYLAQFYFKGRFGLMFHCLCHRKILKPAYQQAGHNYITWIIGPLFGHSPESYFSHHMGMHHVENNNEDDASSTMAYQRDSLRSFFAYFFNFLFLGFKQTFQYLFMRKRKKLYTRLTLGEWVFIFFCIGMCFVNLKATLMVYVIPFFFARFVMMLGNWTQHSFINHSDPEDLYTNAINCINTDYNRICWNDGYHIIHHLRPGLHYTDMPGEFLKRKDELAARKAIVFDGIHYLHIFIYLMTKRYGKLADNLVNINNMFENREQAIALMKERTRRIVPVQL
ncbi:fatty acid desaturase family protein [Niabella beijingensis]|uniref:fatty acid desaturase family protein n=1 Tax=Niabella beijingensis TaxID=2872700 RepID=UPI001CBF2928|nr:fatty acid desaturase [Niabella beijingensis]MBZ4192306.1 fatty acid desaturase [Niabella beijingensis]